MKKSKRLIAAAGVLSVAVLAGCGGNASNSTEGTKSEQSASAESTKDELVFVNYRDIRDLNPHLYAGEMYAQEMLYETLVNITENGYEGGLAESWRMVPALWYSVTAAERGILVCSAGSSIP